MRILSQITLKVNFMKEIGIQIWSKLKMHISRRIEDLYSTEEVPEEFLIIVSTTPKAAHSAQAISLYSMQ